MLTNVIRAIFKRRGGAGDSSRDSARDTLLGMLPKQSICAEIGVYKGSFSAKILEIVQPRVLHLIDPWKFEIAADYKQSWYGGEKGGSQAKMDGIFEGVNRRFARAIAGGQVQVHRAASADAAAQFADAFFDWVYIDGNHRYEFVKADLEAYAPKVKPGGYIAGDDYGEGGWWEGGVKRAVDEFVAAANAELAFLEEGQFCLKKR